MFKRTSSLFAAVAVAALSVGLAACAAIGLNSKPDFMTGAANAQVMVTGLRKLNLTLIDSKVITSAREARNLQAVSDAGNEAIDIAIALFAEDCPDAFMAAVAASAPGAPPATSPPPCTSLRATSKLDAAVAILTATQVYLQAKQGAKQ